MNFDIVYWIVIILMALAFGVQLGRYINKKRGDDK